MELIFVYGNENLKDAHTILQDEVRLQYSNDSLISLHRCAGWSAPLLLANP